MKKSILSFSVIALLMISACAQQKKTTAKKTPDTPTTPATPQTQKTNNITYIRMERTACFGQCPIYKTEIFSDGTVKYTGKMYTDYIGIYETKITTTKAQEIFDEFKMHQVDTCGTSYQSLIADAPGLIYQIKYNNGRDQEIMNADAGPRFLKDLANYVDKRVSPDATWKKIGDIK